MKWTSMQTPTQSAKIVGHTSQKTGFRRKVRAKMSKATSVRQTAKAGSPQKQFYRTGFFQLALSGRPVLPTGRVD